MIDQSHIENNLTNNWPKRRRWMFLSILWLMANAEYIIFFGKDTVLNQNALVTMLGAIVAIITGYVFGVTWDDTSKRDYFARGDMYPNTPPSSDNETGQSSEKPRPPEDTENK